MINGIWIHFLNVGQNYTGTRNIKDHSMLAKLRKIQIEFALWLFIIPSHVQSIFKDPGKQMWHLKYRSRLSAFWNHWKRYFYTVVLPDNLSTHENYQKLSIKKNSRDENFIMSLPMRNKCQIKKKRKTTTWGPWSKCLDSSCDTDLAIKIRR